jgi:hypothetical protein
MHALRQVTVSIGRNLLKCSPEPDAKALDFDILALIATGENGAQDEAKMKALRRMFQPDSQNELTLLAFVQVNQHPARVSRTYSRCQQANPRPYFFGVVIPFTSASGIFGLQSATLL